MKAVLLDWATMGPDLDTSKLQALLPELEIFDETSDEEVAKRIAGATIVLGNKIMISETLFQGAPDMRFIGLTATGTDNIDLEAARKHGVAVANIRAYCTQSVVEHVFGCLLGLTHSLRDYADDVRGGAWQQASNFCMLTHPIDELSAMTLGIVGYGDLGRGVARVGAAFDMDVIIAARPGSPEVPDGRVAFDELLRRADVISLHCPLNEATRGLFGADEFRRMKPSAILINTARGALVDTQALAEALGSGEIAAAAIDVLPTEPPIDGDPLLDYRGNNLIVTPHIAWGTREARQAGLDQLTANIAAFLNGEEKNRVV
ncbi:MAG: D-2-hydroxyacid dehydrogenase [Gammaproteobacteria bacterium]|nr:D-2-hydroxyacid dehydrogenase [Gammaproteobacteria bacterium]MBT8104483.1 D-2-hydroxyacid dehydrogenase [Gammaproteobacteria bacterium]NNF50182.1 D-2-hydroxyacid dehydrogenase [Woeseiaceae bacterium]NNK24497.1 D-2-hydroxyacid dehydrogenase [Woeseiaceae bacterium]NNL63897.1 D-2-hydroxyacid dehydrogenase [Woeseiaceae bacterium]